MNNYCNEIVKFADKWKVSFSDENINYIELVDRYFEDDYENLGFVMKQADEMIDRKYSANQSFKSMTEILASYENSYFIGCVLFKNWRYFNHLAYDAEELLEPENRRFFITGLNRLKELASSREIKDRHATSTIKLIQGL